MCPGKAGATDGRGGRHRAGPLGRAATSSTTVEVYDLPSGQDQPHADVPIPILVGGHATPALRRAARCDGWLHGGGDPEDLPGLLERLGQLRDEEGTADRPFEVHVISLDAFTVDGVRRLEEQGVTDVIVGFRWPYVGGT